MKKLTIFILMLITAVTTSACGDVPTQAQVTPTDSAAPPTASVTVSEVPKIDIGFSLAGEDALSKQLAADIQSECSSLGYTAQISTAATAEQQQKDIQSMLAGRASVIVIDPVDVDALETVLAECEIGNAKVINIIDPINGYVSTLISPNYKTIGEKAGQYAAEVLGATGGGCMLLNTSYDSFTMQLMSDGFNAALEGQANITVASEQFCGADEELAYSTVKSELASKDIKFVFAQSSPLAKGAIRAIEESGKDIKLVAFSGDMDIISAVSSGKAYAAIFFGPAALARQAVSNADSIIKSDSYAPPQYTELTIITVKQADAAGYYKEGAAHAESN